MPSVLSLYREGRNFLKFRSDSQEVSPLLLERLFSEIEISQFFFANRNPLDNLSDNY